VIYIYNAGPLFSEADINQRLLEGKWLRELLAKKDNFIANPIEMPFNNEKVLASSDIFNVDVGHIDLANVFFFELATGDTGTMVEFGMAIEKLRNNKDIKIYPIFSDLRLQRNGAIKTECPVGFNSFVVGACTAHNISIYDSFKEAFYAFKEDFGL
jgi:nucleoside 2-deoxyribosyltransferase